MIEKQHLKAFIVPAYIYKLYTYLYIIATETKEDKLYLIR